MSKYSLALNRRNQTRSSALNLVINIASEEAVTMALVSGDVEMAHKQTQLHKADLPMP
jgi:hypothetical protein